MLRSSPRRTIRQHRVVGGRATGLGKRPIDLWRRPLDSVFEGVDGGVAVAGAVRRRSRSTHSGQEPRGVVRVVPHVAIAPVVGASVVTVATCPPLYVMVKVR